MLLPFNQIAETLLLITAGSCVVFTFAAQKRRYLLATTQKHHEDIQHQAILQNILKSVTQSKLHLCAGPEDLPLLQTQVLYPIALTARSLGEMRTHTQHVAAAFGFSSQRQEDLVTAVHEAALNAITHGQDGQGRVCVSASGTIQVWIRDDGEGIEPEQLAHTHWGQGQGLWLMCQMADRLWLQTDASGTTVVIEMDRMRLDDMTTITEAFLQTSPQ